MRERGVHPDLEHAVVIGSFGGSVEAISEIVAPLCRSLFPSMDDSYVAERLPLVAMPELLLAKQADQIVGFKLGYRLSHTRLFSWLGGVLPTHRRQGVARRLAELQHARARAAGMNAIETRSRSENSAMIIVNLRSGFRIVGVESDAHGRFVVLQRKDLLEQQT